MRVVFMGTPQFAVPSLAALAEARFEVAEVCVQPDRPAGRGRKPAVPPVKAFALERGLTLAQPEDANSAAALARLRELAPDLFVVVAYGCILSPELLRVPRLGSINVHASLLPDFRGAAPVACAILEGAYGTGVTTMWMNAGIDTGDVILQRYTPIQPEESAGELAERLSRLGARLLVETLREVERGTAPRAPQDLKAGSYCRKLRKEHGVILWAQDAERVARHVRAMTPWPGAHTVFEPEAGGDGRAEAHGQALLVERARVLDRLVRDVAPGRVLAADRVGPAQGVVVACQRGALELVTVRPAGKRSMPALDWWHGLRGAAGHFLCPGSEP
jgi:methionyl-tRNA formyltransferase